MLSRPPASFAAATNSVTASSSVSALPSTAAIPSSLTIVVRPSEQSRKTSSGRALKVSVSTSTDASGPSARVMIERCGWSSACSSEMPALAAQLLDQRVVGRQHPQLAVAQQVGAAVADVGERRPRRPRRSRRSASSPSRSGSSRAGRGCGCARSRPRRSSAGRPPGASLPRTAGSNDSAAIRDATSPAWAPPIPSATANNGALGEVRVLVRGPLAAGVGTERQLADAQRHQPPPGSSSSKRNSVSPILISSRSESSASPRSRPPFR